jgi:hypothetical protein
MIDATCEAIFTTKQGIHPASAPDWKEWKVMTVSEVRPGEVRPGSETPGEPRPTLKVVETTSRPTTQDWLCRRLNTALIDLGLGVEGILGRSWATRDGDTIAFRPLLIREVDRFVCELEELAAGDARLSDRQPASSGDTPEGTQYEQLTLF